jgi:UTP--glucose-1-phosphate uridylyltransferase
MSIKTVIIPAAGKGTRLLPATKVTAKELLPVYDRVVMDFAIDEAAGAGAERIVIVISTTKTAIQSYLSQADLLPEVQPSTLASGPRRSATEVVYVFQDQALGLGHAVLCCKRLTLPGPFAVLLPDDIIMGPNCLADMADHYNGGHMIAAMQVKAHETSQYGMFRVSGLPKDRCIPVSGMVEKPAPGSAPSSFAAVGRYILDPMIFDVLEHTPKGKGGEFQLTDAIAIATHAVPVVAFQFSGTRHDCGNHDGLLGASLARQASVQAENAASAAAGLLHVTAPGATQAMVPTLDHIA